MLLTFDVGNSETTLGLFEDSALRAHWRIMTDVARSSRNIKTKSSCASSRR